MVLPLLGSAARILLPSMADIEGTSNAINEITQAFGIVAQAANAFYGATIASNIQLQNSIRQSTVVLSAQTKFFNQAGEEVTDFAEKYNLIGQQMKKISRDIELETRDIVGATDSMTNAVLNNVITNFGSIKGQSKELANDMQGITPLVVNLTSALSTFQIPEWQFPQEIRSLLAGDVNNVDSMLAQRLRGLGLTKEVANDAKAAGEWYDVLNKKLKVFADANIVGAESLTNSLSVIKDVQQQFARDLGAEPTMGLEKGLARVKALISNKEFAQGLTDFAKGFGEPIGQAIETALATASRAFNTLGEELGSSDLEAKGAAIGALIGDIIVVTAELATAFGVLIAKVANLGADILNAFNIAGDILTLNFFEKEVKVTANADTSEANAKLDDLDKVTLKNKILGFDTSDIGNSNAISKLNDFVNSLRPEAKLELQTDSPERYQKVLDDTQKILDSKGMLKTLLDVAISITPVGIVQNIVRAPQIEEIKEGAKNVVALYESELKSQEKIISELKLNAPKVAEIDITDIKNFVPKFGQTLQQQISELRGKIDFSKLTEKGQDQINAELNKISSSTSLKASAQNIATIVSSNLSNIDTSDFANKLALINSTLTAAEQEKQRILKDAKDGNYLGDVDGEVTRLDKTIAKYRAQLDSIVEASNPQVAAQQKIVDSMSTSNKGYEEAVARLKELKDAAVESANVLAVATPMQPIGQTVIKSYEEAKTAILALYDTIGDDSVKRAEKFETAMSSIETAMKTGAISADTLKASLASMISSDVDSLENRLKALDTLKKLIADEVDLKKSLLGVNSTMIDLEEQRGTISSEQAGLDRNKLEISQLELQIEEKKAGLIADQTALQVGLSKEIETKTAAIEAQFNAETQALQAKIENKQISIEQANTEKQSLETKKQIHIAELQSLSTGAEAGSIAMQKTRAEIASLEVQKQKIAAQNIELQLSKELAESEAKRKIASAQNENTNLALKVEVQAQIDSGQISEFNAAIQDSFNTYDELLFNAGQKEQELAEIRAALSESDGASQKFKSDLLSQQLVLEKELLQLELQKSAAQESAALAYETALVNQAKQFAELTQNEVAATNELNAAIEKNRVSQQSIVDIQKQIVQNAQQTAAALNNIEISGLDFDKSLIEQAIDLQGQLRANNNIAANERTAQNNADRDWLTERLAIISNATGIETASAANVQAIIAEKAKLEIENNDILKQQKIDAANLEAQNGQNKLNLLALTLQGERAILEVKNSQLEAEKNLLLAKQAYNGFLTTEQQSALTVLNTDIAAQAKNKASIDATIASIGTQKDLLAQTAQNTIKVANNENEYANKVVTTTAQLDIQGLSKQNVVDKTQNAAKSEAQHANVAAQTTANIANQNAAKAQTADNVQNGRGLASIFKNNEGYKIDGQQYSEKDGADLIAKAKAGQNSRKGAIMLMPGENRISASGRSIGIAGMSVGEYNRRKFLGKGIGGRQGDNIGGLYLGPLDSPSVRKESSSDSDNPIELQGYGGKLLGKRGKYSGVGLRDLNGNNIIDTNEQNLVAGETNLASQSRNIRNANFALTDSLKAMVQDFNDQRSRVYEEVNKNPESGNLKKRASKIRDTFEDINKEESRQSAKLRASKDPLEVQFALNAELTSKQVSLLTLQLNNDKNDREERAKQADKIKADIAVLKSSLKEVASYSVLSYRLAESSKELQILGTQRQTKQTVNEISKIADDLLDFYGAEAANPEIILLSQQLEALRKDPNATSLQIVQLAEKIQESTAKTAENTEREPSKYSNVLDAIKQGGFFGGDYREARDNPGTLTKDVKNNLLYSGFNFENPLIPDGNKSDKNKKLSEQLIERGQANEKIKDIKLVEQEIKKDNITELNLTIQGLSDKIIDLTKAQQTLSPQAVAVPQSITVSSNPANTTNKNNSNIYEDFNNGIIKNNTNSPGKSGPGSLTTAPPKNQSLVLRPKQTITNNYFPNSGGSVSSMMRTNGF